MTDKPATTDPSPADLEPRDAAGARRHAALAVRRDVGGAVPHPELRLRQRRAGRGALQERGAGFIYSPLRQPDRRHVRGAHAAAGRRARPRAPRPPAWRPSPPRCCASSRPATTSWRRARCSAPAATWCEDLLSALRHRLARWSTAATSTPGSRPCGPTPRRSSSRRRPTRRSTWSTSPPCPRSPTRPARWSWSTTCSPRRMLQKPLQARRRRRRLLGHQAHRRPGPLPRRRRAGLAGLREGPPAQLSCSTPGPSLSPFNAWVMLKGLETLPLRVRAQCESGGQDRRPPGRRSRASRACCICGRAGPPAGRAGQAADDGLRPVVTFEVDGGKAAAFRFLNALKLIKHLQQPRRRQEPDHASGHHHAPAPEARGAGRARHLRRHAAAFGRPRSPSPISSADIDRALAASRIG